ncbi:Asp/Glu racemase [Pseudonocardia kujensis]|uniref:maleate cis-trans isomerase family protein n=1 Tax=Pseudonocardia kujensis TaxID=1128675 RepID=UPI001E506835|nr:Asp/Glu racemase [Pseudonocardia kujensis]MCE0766159.1 Asp/Glu racemase [Pseudonocardia kujensis]
MPAELSVGLVDPDAGHGAGSGDDGSTDDTPGVGVVAPFDFALDRELWRWAPDDVSLYLTRLPFFTTPVTVEMAVAVGDRRAVRRATRDVLTPRPGVVTFACTSGSFVSGVAGEFVLRRTMIEAGAPEATTTSGALVDALHLLGVQNLAIATPYIAAVTDRLVTFLADNGVTTVASEGLGLLGNIWRVGYEQVVSIVKAVDRPEADALFISCTNLPTYDIIEPLEQALGKPVITANQVTMWASLRAIGRQAVGGGRLLEVPLQRSVA